MEHVVPDEVKRRAEDDEELAQDEPATCYGGFKSWQVVAASQDIVFGNLIGVRQGTPGIVVGNFNDGNHLTVKFDKREDASELCVTILPSTLMEPLPGGFQLGQQVCASKQLMLGGSVVVQLGSLGMVVGAVDQQHMHVLFNERTDGMEGCLHVHCEMISPHRLLVGGFRLGQKIQACKDLVVNDHVAVPFNATGIVMGEYSDARLTVAFDVEGEGQSTHFNVPPTEVRAFCEIPSDMYPGQIVQARSDLVSTNYVVILKAGTRGVVIGVMDEMRVIVSFSGDDETDAQTRCLTVPYSAIEKAADTTEMPAESPDEPTDFLTGTGESLDTAFDAQEATDSTHIDSNTAGDITENIAD